MHFPAFLSLTLVLVGITSAHPGHNINDEILERRAFKNLVRQVSLAHCAEKLKAQGFHDLNIQRRAATVEKARRDRQLTARDADTVLTTSHDDTALGYTKDTSISNLFSGNSSCVLTPEVTVGPYYVGGESIRKDVTEDQKGVELTVDYQVIDVDSCEPVPNVYVEIWHCNSTGVYSGVVSGTNGNSSVKDNINTTFLRGIQKTDSNGVVQFDTLFPGHYTGRTTHIHVLVHANATEFFNKTLGNEVYSSHIGQTFFDQDLITEVEKISPYTSNEQTLTTNAEDGILAEEATGVDPLLSYTLLGSSVSDGLFAWGAFGINTTVVDSVNPASFLYKEGGVENPNRSSGGPSGSGGNRTSPSGVAGASSGPLPRSTAIPTAIMSVANRYTVGVVAFSLIGLILPLLWL